MTKFLVVYHGGNAPSSKEEGEKVMAAWGQWMADHAAVIVEAGGPLGVTKKVSEAGVADTHNAVAGYIVVRADSHEAAARMFENHPHFAIFPGEAVEVMEQLPIPGA